MNKPVVETRNETGELFADALRRDTLVVMNYRIEERWLSIKGKLFGVDPRRRRLAVRCETTLLALPVPLGAGQYVGLAFRHGHRKCLCSTVAESVCDAAGAAVVEFAWPDTVQLLQRRAYHRTPLPESTHTHVLVWSGAREDRPAEPAQSRRCWYARLVDVSLGGMAAIIADSEIDTFECEQSVWTEFLTPDNRRITTEAIVKHVTPRHNATALIGLQFVGLEFGGQAEQTLRGIIEFTASLSRGSAFARGRRPNLQSPRPHL
jgi:c-di-GMP-binding flagellar brake protein YcgR